MKKLFLGILLAAAGAIGALPAAAQVAPATTLNYTWGAVSTTGQVGKYLVLNAGHIVPTFQTIDWTVTGTAPSACTFRVEGSSDGVAWYGLDQTSPTTTSCVTQNMETIIDRPVIYLRINAVTYTQGDGTTSVVFHFTGSN